MCDYPGTSTPVFSIWTLHLLSFSTVSHWEHKSKDCIETSTTYDCATK